MASYPERRSPSHRFLPPDPRVTEPYRFTPQLALRVGVLAGIALILFAVLFLRLWALQVLSGDRYLNAAQNNLLRTVPVEAPRGSILDRNRKVIVSNVPGTAVQIWTSDLPDEGRYAMFKKLSRILHVPMPRLTRALEEGKDDPLTPILVKTAVHEDQVAALKERSAEFPGVEVVGTYLRDYDYRSLAAQVLGYVGEISPDELERLEKSGYRAGDRIGKTGIESAFDTYLRGEAGTEHLRVDSLGRPQGQGFQPGRAPTPGNNVRLTLDIGLQRAAERALSEGIRLAHADEQWHADGGAIVALDPRDGAVLALASNPTYKPSVYVGRVDPKKLGPLINPKVAKEHNYPGINRATAGVYPPGSTFKPLTAIAAVSDGLLSPYEYIQCTPYAEYGLDKQRFKNWNQFTNMPMTLTTALAQSCDTYFYDVGNRYYERGENEREYWTRMQDWAKRFGFGQAPGLDIGGEEKGLLPTPAWRKRIGRNAWDKAWNPGDLIQLAIGQKDMTVTPLQMARFYAALANGGKLVTPYLVSAVEQPAGDEQLPVTLDTFPPTPPQTIRNLDPQALSVVRDGLYEATHDADGTSSGVFGSFPVPVAGKTGTAEKVVNLPGYPVGHQEDQAWWCGWGPFDGSVYVTRTGARRPPLVVCAVIENGGHGGVAAAPAALRVFEHWFREQAGAQGVVLSD